MCIRDSIWIGQINTTTHCFGPDSFQMISTSPTARLVRLAETLVLASGLCKHLGWTIPAVVVFVTQLVSYWPFFHWLYKQSHWLSYPRSQIRPNDLGYIVETGISDFFTQIYDGKRLLSQHQPEHRCVREWLVGELSVGQRHSIVFVTQVRMYTYPSDLLTWFSLSLARKSIRLAVIRPGGLSNVLSLLCSDKLLMNQMLQVSPRSARLFHSFLSLSRRVISRSHWFSSVLVNSQLRAPTLLMISSATRYVEPVHEKHNYISNKNYLTYFWTAECLPVVHQSSPTGIDFSETASNRL